MLNKVKDTYGLLSRAERKVADAILGQPHKVLQLAIAEMADLAGVSEPTVIRFCRSLGQRGYSDFKLQLAQSLATAANYVHTDLDQGHDVDDVVREIFDHSVNSLLNARNSLGHDQLRKAVGALKKALRVEIFGFGASAVVAADAGQKLMRLNVPVCVHHDRHNQIIIASVLDMHSVVIAISHSGSSIDLIDSARLARESGATVIAITRAGSPLAELADILLSAGLDEDTSRYMPMRSRLVHLVMIDVLIVSLSLALGDVALERLSKVKKNLRNLRVPDS